MNLYMSLGAQTSGRMSHISAWWASRVRHQDQSPAASPFAPNYLTQSHVQQEPPLPRAPSPAVRYDSNPSPLIGARRAGRPSTL